MRLYQAYGQYIASDISLPQLPTVHGVSTSDAGVVVRKTDGPRTVTALPSNARCVYDPDGQAVSVYETDGDFYWDSDTLGTVTIRDGETIVFQPQNGLPDRYRRAFVLGPGFRSLLIQQGFLVCHASAVVVNGGAIAFVGQSETGKSTTAAAMHRRGHPFLTDDVLPVQQAENGYAVIPGFSAPKVTARMATRLEYETPIDDSSRINGERQYYDAASIDCDATAVDAQSPVPLNRIYVLSWGDEIAIAPPKDSLSPLLRGSYHLYDETDTDRFADHFRRCADVAGSVPVRELRRPRSPDALDEVVSAIEADVRRT